MGFQVLFKGKGSCILTLHDSVFLNGERADFITMFLPLFVDIELNSHLLCLRPLSLPGCKHFQCQRSRIMNLASGVWCQFEFAWKFLRTFSQVNSTRAAILEPSLQSRPHFHTPCAQSHELAQIHLEMNSGFHTT